MIAPSVLVSSSLRKLINRSATSLVIIPSLCFNKGLVPNR